MTNLHHQPTYKRHRFPREIIAYAIWLYFNFNLSYRDVETILVERGITVSYEAIRYWLRARIRPENPDKNHQNQGFLGIV